MCVCVYDLGPSARPRVGRDLGKKHRLISRFFSSSLSQNAHMTVIEAMMVLYAKEVASSGRISSALER